MRTYGHNLETLFETVRGKSQERGGGVADLLPTYGIGSGVVKTEVFLVDYQGG